MTDETPTPTTPDDFVVGTEDDKTQALEAVMREASQIIGMEIKVEYNARIVSMNLTDGRVDTYQVVTDDGAQLIVKGEHVHFPPAST